MGGTAKTLNAVSLERNILSIHFVKTLVKLQPGTKMCPIIRVISILLVEDYCSDFDALSWWRICVPKHVNERGVRRACWTGISSLSPYYSNLKVNKGQ